MLPPGDKPSGEPEMEFSEASKWALREEARRHDPDLISRHLAAEILGVTVRTLQRWHRQGIGPQRKNRPDQRPIRYSRTEVKRWAADNRMTALIQRADDDIQRADDANRTSRGT